MGAGRPGRQCEWSSKMTFLKFAIISFFSSMIYGNKYLFRHFDVHLGDI